MVDVVAPYDTPLSESRDPWKYGDFDIRSASNTYRDVGHVFDVKINPYLKIKFSFIFHQPAVTTQTVTFFIVFRI